MKLITLVFAVALTGCSFILPKPHDPAMFNNLVQTKVAVDKLNCDNKDWSDAQEKIERLKVYTTWRSDPQADSVTKLQEALNKAHESKSKTFCESVLRLSKTRISVIADAWRGR